VRPGILPMMVKEMLNTRIMIKRAMKRHCGSASGSGSKVLEKVMDARQLAVKLLSNVTCKYGKSITVFRSAC
jgi:DNA polymerase zeta